MNKVEEAIYFAVKAHAGQKRKSEDIDYIFHPFTVGMILEREGCSDEVVIAGMLHDVVEDTSYTVEDIRESFGEKVASLVLSASEPNKSYSWEDRKQHTIDYMKTASLDEKLIVCADKIHNLSCLFKDYKIKGDKLWDDYKRGKEKNKWYYAELFKSLINNENVNNTLFVRYKYLFEQIFDSKLEA